MNYTQVPPDLRVRDEKLPILFWTKRGRAVEVNEKDGLELLKSDRAWRRVTDEEISKGIKAGSYNPIYDVGENKNASVDIEINLPEDEGDTLDCIIV